MGRRFEMMRDGDELHPIHINEIRRELNRWRTLRCVAPLRVHGVEDGVSNIEISVVPTNQRISLKLTATGDSNGKHEWKAVVWNGTAYVDTGKVGTTNGDWALELNGLRCPNGDEVYEAWKGATGMWTFQATRTLAVCGNSNINASSSGSVYLWSVVGGTETNTNTSITAYNWSDLSAVNSGRRLMLTPHAGRWYIDFEACS